MAGHGFGDDGAKGAERLAIKGAQQKGVKLILARADFDAHARRLPSRRTTN